MAVVEGPETSIIVEVVNGADDVFGDLEYDDDAIEDEEAESLGSV